MTQRNQRTEKFRPPALRWRLISGKGFAAKERSQFDAPSNEAFFSSCLFGGGPWTRNEYARKKNITENRRMKNEPETFSRFTIFVSIVGCRSIDRLWPNHNASANRHSERSPEALW